MIVIAIIGILAAIALPAYARYMARARFTEVTSALDGVKKQVELCIFDLGPAHVANGVVPLLGCANGASGNGWRIGNAVDYATKYVASIAVDEQNSIVTATAQPGNGLNGHTYSVAPMFGPQDNGIIDWVRADGTAYGAHPAVGGAAENSCIAAELC